MASQGTGNLILFLTLMTITLSKNLPVVKASQALYTNTEIFQGHITAILLIYCNENSFNLPSAELLQFPNR